MTVYKLFLFRTLPLHDSFTIIAIRVAAYRKESVSIEEFYESRYRNIFRMDGTESKWFIYHKATNEVKKAVAQIQTYIENTNCGTYHRSTMVVYTPVYVL